MDPPTKNQAYDKEITFFHPRIGQRKYYAYDQQHLVQFKEKIYINSQLNMFSNYYFEVKGNRVYDLDTFEYISSQKQIKIDIVFGVYDYKTAQYHIAKTMDCVFNPQYYLYLCKAEKQFQSEDKTSEEPLKNNIHIDIQNLKPDLTQPMLTASIQIQKKINLLISFSLSGFNPVPASQKLNGDLIYLHARTLEGQDIHITACPAGFFVNQSKISCFNPAKSTIYKGIYGSLIDLFKAVSDRFRQTLQICLSQIKITEAMKYKFYSLDRVRKRRWLEAEKQHGWNQRRMIADQHLKAQLIMQNDWNQIFQKIHEFDIQYGKTNIQKAAQFSKSYAQFQLAAYQGATFILQGKLTPLNPTDQKKKHIYIFNKIFFSIANQTVYDHSQQKGQQATPSSSSINTDLINIEILFNLSIPDLHVLHMVIINYCGEKVIAQCIIPGILSIDQTNCSQYGSIDDGKTVETNPEFQKIMLQVCDKLGIQEDIEVIDGNGVKKRIAGSPDIKGILGSDKRKYILDLLRLSPRDLNYEGIRNQNCVLRPELIRNFRKHKKNQQLKFNVNIGTDIKFQKNQNYDEQLNTLKEAAQYLKNTAIPNLIETLKNYPSQYLTNNEGITRAFHLWGVNMRYLGQVYIHESIRNQIQIKLVIQRIIFIRSAKHMLRMAMRNSNIMHLGATVVNILNCIFGRKSHLLLMQQGIIQNEETLDKNADKQAKKKKKKKNKQTNQPINQIDFNQLINVIKIQPNKFLSMKPQQVWEQIGTIAFARYNHILPRNQLQFEVFKYPFQKLATLRDVCLAVGLVLQQKNYDIFQGSQGVSSPHFNDKILPFNCKNIIMIQPRAKRMKIQPQNLTQREKQSEQLISSYQVKQALKIDTLLQRHNIAICGGLNQPAIKLFTRMGRILYILGQYKSAIYQQQKNLCMLESLHCQDHWLNIQSHINLGLYNIAGNDKNKVVYYMTKGIYLMLIAFGQTSPDLLVSFANLARIYQMNKQYKQAIKCYKTAMKYIQQIHGKFHVKMSFCYTSLATICYQMADIKAAIQNQTQNVAILSKILPETDTKLQDAQKILKMYRQMQQKTQLQNNFARMVEPIRKPEEEKDTKRKGKKY